MKRKRIAVSSSPTLVAAMTIAGSDPSGGAGMQADLKTFAAHNVYGLSVITAIIAQNSAHVSWVMPVEAEMVAAQIQTIVAERNPDALKIGALGSASVVQAVAAAIDSLRLPAPVIDPVLMSSSGVRLLDTAGEHILRTQLIPLACLITPNVPEAEALSGIKIDGPEVMRRAARAIVGIGAHAVLIKGGHTSWRSENLPLAGRSQSDKVVDVFFDGRHFVEFPAPRIAGEGAHGTGCALSAAITAWLARGADIETAIGRAKRFMTRALRNAFKLGEGRPVLDHFAKAASPASGRGGRALFARR